MIREVNEKQRISALFSPFEQSVKIVGFRIERNANQNHTPASPLFLAQKRDNLHIKACIPFARSFVGTDWREDAVLDDQRKSFSSLERSGRMRSLSDDASR